MDWTQTPWGDSSGPRLAGRYRPFAIGGLVYLKTSRGGGGPGGHPRERRRGPDRVAQRALDPLRWPSIETVAPEVPKWRHEETLDYVKRIEHSLSRMDDSGKVVKK